MIKISDNHVSTTIPNINNLFVILYFFCLILFEGGMYDPISVYPNLKYKSSIKTVLKYNFQSLILMNNRSCVGNVR